VPNELAHPLTSTLQEPGDIAKFESHMTSTSISSTVPTIDAANLAILGETLQLSCVELMAEYGLTAHPTQAQAQPQAASEPPVSVLVAGVDFKGNELRGTVALWATRTVIAETTRGAVGLDATDQDLPDWTCELANQLIGRMKNKLRSYDVSLSLNVPRLIAGSGLQELGHGVRYRFSCDYGALAACLDVLITPGFVLKQRHVDETAEALVEEGDFTLL
jgi:hypothetical protein